MEIINKECNIPNESNDLKIFIKRLIEEVQKLSKTTEATLLKHDGKIGDLCSYLKTNLSNSIRCIINDMSLNGEIDNLIRDLVSTDLSIIKKLFVTPEMFGAVGDGKCDDTVSIKEALFYMNEHNITTLIFDSKKTYMVKGYEEGQEEGSTTGLLDTTGLVLSSGQMIDLNGSTLKVIPNKRQNYNVFTLKDVKDVVIKNGKIIGDVDKHEGTGEWGYGISLRNAKNITLKDLHISKCWGDGINLNNNGTNELNENIIIDSVICEDNRRQGMSIENAKDMYVVNSSFIKTGSTKRTNPAAGVDIEPGSDLNSVSNVKFENCKFNDNYNNGLVFDGEKVSDILVSKCEIMNNKGTSSYSVININESKNIKFIDSIIEKQTGHAVINVMLNGVVEFINNKLKDINLTIRNNKSSNMIKFINNVFTGNRNLEWNCIIEAVSTDDVCSDNTMIVNDNIFKYQKSNKIHSYVKCSSGAHFEKLIAKKNVFYNGNVGITTSVSSEIESNTFISARNSSISIIGSEGHYSIRNNQFEHSNCMVESIGIINNVNNKNIVLLGNIAYKECTNPNDTNEEGKVKNIRFLQNLNPAGISLDSNNHIL